MKRYQLLGSLLLIPALALATVTLTGCTKPTETGKEKDKDGQASGKEKEKDKDGGGSKDNTVALEAKTDGVIKGKVVYDGTPPKMPFIDAMKEHADKNVCLAGADTEKQKQEWIVGGGNGVANVVVWLEAPEGKHFNVTKDLRDERVKAQPTIDQPHCAFVPHVVAMYTGSKKEPSGQKLLVKNSSEVSHNTKIEGSKLDGNAGYNANIAPGKTEEVDVKYQAKPLQIACDKHTWMNASLVTFDQPYFAVTDKDGGFEIHNVPVGAKLTVRMWHESFGDNVRGTAKAGATQEFKAGDNSLEMKIN